MDYSFSRPTVFEKYSFRVCTVAISSSPQIPIGLEIYLGLNFQMYSYWFVLIINFSSWSIYFQMNPIEKSTSQ